MQENRITALQQHLKDLEKVMQGDNDTNTQLQKAIKVMQEYLEQNTQTALEEEKLFARHRYPEKSIQFVKMTNNLKGLEKTISGDAYKLLIVLCRQCHQSNNQIQISKTKDVVTLTGCGKTAAAAKVDELVKYGLITPLTYIHTKPTVYMINPALVLIGTGQVEKLQKRFWEATGCTYTYNKHGELEIAEESTAYQNFCQYINIPGEYYIGREILQIDNQNTKKEVYSVIHDAKDYRSHHKKKDATADTVAPDSIIIDDLKDDHLPWS